MPEQPCGSGCPQCYPYQRYYEATARRDREPSTPEREHQKTSEKVEEAGGQQDAHKNGEESDSPKHKEGGPPLLYIGDNCNTEGVEWQQVEDNFSLLSCANLPAISTDMYLTPFAHFSDGRKWLPSSHCFLTDRAHDAPFRSTYQSWTYVTCVTRANPTWLKCSRGLLRLAMYSVCILLMLSFHTGRSDTSPPPHKMNRSSAVRCGRW